jgi:uncharacterized protein (DUF58 family)
MFRRRRTRLTREGWYYLLVLAFVVIGALLREINLLMIMAGLLIGPILLNWRMAVASLRPLTLVRRVPETVVARDLLSVDVTLQSKRGLLGSWAPGSWAVTVEDNIRRVAPGGEERLRTSVFFWRTRRGSSARVAYRGRILRRGRYVFGPMTISTRFPLGLVRRSMVVEAPQELIVLPRQGRLKPAWRALSRRALHLERGQRTQFMAMEGDFHSLRDWRPGDARRQIHWRTTARRRAPVVRRLEQPRNADVAILLDLSAVPSGAEGEQATERAISFVATVVSDLCRQGGGWMVLGTAARSQQVFRGAPSAALLRECLLHLATLEAEPGETLDALLKEVVSGLRRDTRVVVVTASGDGSAHSLLRQRWMGPGDRPIPPALVVDAGGDQLDEFYESDSRHEGAS